MNKTVQYVVRCLLRQSRIFGAHVLQTRVRPSISSLKCDKLTEDIRASPLMELPALSIMPTRLLMRSLLMTSILSSPRLLNICLPLMSRIAKSKSSFLNPDKNFLLGEAVGVMFYRHFCAGRNHTEVKQTIEMMKGIGFKGVILGYAKDVVVDSARSQEQFTESGRKIPSNTTIEMWQDGNLQTLPMIGKGDFLGIKYTGAGPVVTEAMRKCLPPPVEFWKSLLKVCDAAASQSTRVWIDAEQQVFQPSIDKWTIDLMRHYNRNGKGQIYTTFQAYLKSTVARIKEHLELAKREDWLLGIKLVRGAYISSEQRHLIHDTKADTDESYNFIVQNLLMRTFPGIPNDEFPEVLLFLASHNSQSVQKAYSLYRSLILAGQCTIDLEFGQLQGMADELSCGLLKLCQKECFNTESSGLDDKMAIAVAPKAFKCLAWGSTQECMQFLVRRAVENKGSMERSHEWLVGLRQEMWRRVRVAFRIERPLSKSKYDNTGV